MADKKITQLTNITGANLVDADEFVVVDISADETKAITLGELKEAFDAGSGFVRITGDTMTGDLTVPNVITSGNVDGRDVSADGTKLDTIETNADVTDTTNVTAAGALMTTGGTMTGNITFGDNDKAIFGAGSDLQIYHNGSHSTIEDVGTGNLQIHATDFRLRNSAGTESMILANADGNVQLYYDNALKLATTSTGIDVKNVASGANAKLNITTESTGGGTSEILFSDNTTGRGRIYYDHGSSPEELHIETTGTDAIVIDNSQNVTMPNGNLDVTGTVTADGLTVDGNINANGLIIADNGEVLAGQDASGFYYGSGFNTDNTLPILIGDNNASIRLRTGNAPNRLQIAGNGDISFYEDTGTTPKFFWDASNESLGIGTSSPSSTYGVDSTKGIRIISTVPNVTLQESDASSHTWQLGSYGGNFSIRDVTHASYPFTVADGGNVGIGTSNPARGIDIVAANSAQLRIRNTEADATIKNGYLQTGHYTNSEQDVLGVLMQSQASANTLYLGGSSSGMNAMTGIRFYTAASNTTLSGTERMRIDSSGNVGIGTSSPSSFGSGRTVVEVTGSTGGFILTDDGTAQSRMGTEGGIGYLGTRTNHPVLITTNNTERMRIDSSGNLLVGTTSTTVYTSSSGGDAGVNLRADGQISNSSNSASVFNRMASNGPIHLYYKDGTPVGSIGSEGGDALYIQSGTTSGTGLLFSSNGTAIRAARNGVTVDATLDLGSDTRRFKDLYLSGGVYLGGVGSSNKLDDYEEGTFTPTLNNGTVSVDHGSWVKIGNLVTVTLVLGNFSDSTSGTLTCNNMPFVSKSGDAYQAHGVVMYQEFNISGAQGITAFMNDGTASLVWYANQGSSNWTAVRNSHIDTASNAYLRTTITYRTT